MLRHNNGAAGVLSEADPGRTDLVGHYEISPLGGQLCPAECDELRPGCGLRRKTHDHLARPAPGAQPGQDVRSGDQLQRHRCARLFQLLVGGHGRAVVGYGRRHDDHVCPVTRRQCRLFHLGRAFHPYDLGPRRWGQRARGDKGDGCPPLDEFGRDGVALLARTAVGNVADRVERLPGPARGHDGRDTGQRAGPVPEHGGEGGDDLVSVRQAPLAVVPTRQSALRRVEYVHAAPAQKGDVVLHGRVLPHLGVHGRADQDGRPGGQQRCRQKVRRDAGAVAAYQPSGSGRHHDGVNAATKGHVRDRRRQVTPAVRTEQRRPGRLGGQGGERQWRDEVGRPLREDGTDQRARVGEPPAHLDGLVSGDTTADTEDHPFAVQWAESAPTGRSHPGATGLNGR